ncbi:hypothetical protein, partial [Salinarimonas soli]|uniref:hypothetical protein n=1 Tax=Salinarimonas soli TaxID=1638099 RepID=UPI001AEDFF75
MEIDPASLTELTEVLNQRHTPQGMHLKRASKVNMKPAPSLTQAPKGTQRKDNAAHASLPHPIHLSKS